ncbi:MAG: nitroreductase [Micrococcales bacterium]
MKETIKPTSFSAFLASRRTTRDFLPTPVDPKLVDQLIADGLTAPSWSNTRPFMVAVADGQLRDQISEEMLKRWALLSAARTGNLWDKLKLVFTGIGLPISDYTMLTKYPSDLIGRSRRVGKELYALLEVPRGDAKARDAHWANNYRFFGAPTVIFVFIHKSLGVHAANDAGLFAENLILSAHAHDLGTCAQGAVALWRGAIRKYISVPKNYKLLYGIAIGYASDDKVNTFQAHRLDVEEIKIK